MCIRDSLEVAKKLTGILQVQSATESIANYTSNQHTACLLYTSMLLGLTAPTDGEFQIDNLTFPNKMCIRDSRLYRASQTGNKQGTSRRYQPCGGVHRVGFLYCLRSQLYRCV